MAEKNYKSGTFINGIAASQHLDSSGEILMIDGLDISSLEAGHGTFNWEHKNDNSSQTVGKVLKAKKIFSEEDCEDETQLHFWGICKTPFLYVMGELFDGVGHEQAKEAAAMLRYDAQKRTENSDYKNVISFSIEGGKIEKRGNEITRSIARKVTLTISACNKMAIAEEYVPKMDKKSNDSNILSNLFKTESFEPVEILEKGARVLQIAPQLEEQEKPLAPVIPIRPNQPSPNAGAVIGQTSSGKGVFSHQKPIDYKDFSSQDHHDAMNHHYKMVEGAKTFDEKQHHFNMAKMHMNARNITENREKRFAVGRQKATDKALAYARVKKSMDVAPSQLTGYAALQREDLVRDIKKQAEEAYNKIKDKKALVKSIMDTNPNLFKHQAEALAKMAAYKNLKKAEKSLENLHKKIKK